MNKLARHRLLQISLGSFSVLIICDTVAKAKKTYSKTFKIDLKLVHHMVLNCSRFLICVKSRKQLIFLMQFYFLCIVHSSFMSENKFNGSVVQTNGVLFCYQVGTFVLYSVAAAAAEQLKPHLVSMLQLLNEVVHDSENRQVPYYAIR